MADAGGHDRRGRRRAARLPQHRHHPARPARRQRHPGARAHGTPMQLSLSSSLTLQLPPADMRLSAVPPSGKGSPCTLLHAMNCPLAALQNDHYCLVVGAVTCTVLTAGCRLCQQGIVGETYERMLAGEEALADPRHPLYLPDDSQFSSKGAEEGYAVEGFFGQPAFSLFGREAARAGPAQARRLIESSSSMAFPLHASSRTAWIARAFASSRQAAFHATGGRKGRFL